MFHHFDTLDYWLLPFLVHFLYCLQSKQRISGNSTGWSIRLWLAELHSIGDTKRVVVNLDISSVIQTQQQQFLEKNTDLQYIVIRKSHMLKEFPPTISSSLSIFLNSFLTISLLSSLLPGEVKVRPVSALDKSAPITSLCVRLLVQTRKHTDTVKGVAFTVQLAENKKHHTEHDKGNHLPRPTSSQPNMGTHTGAESQ